MICRRGSLPERMLGIWCGAATEGTSMSASQPAVFLVDDDPTTLKTLGRSLRARGFNVLAWSSPQTFLDEHDRAAAGCLIIDFAMSGISGPEVQSALSSGGCERIVVFISESSDVQTAVRAMKTGAASFLGKPVDLEILVSEIEQALARDRVMRAAMHRRLMLLQRLGSLTRREYEVLSLVVAGRLNKQIAATLGIVEKTSKVHRGRMMEKMGARSLADLFALISEADPHLLTSMRRTCMNEIPLASRGAPELRSDRVSSVEYPCRSFRPS